MLQALKDHFAKHSFVYLVAILLSGQAFTSAFYDNFWLIEPDGMAKLGWWQIVAAFLKSLSFAIGVASGYLINQFKNENEKPTVSPADSRTS